MTPWYSFLTDLGDRGGETAIRSIRRAALAIRANNVLLPEQKSADRGTCKKLATCDFY